jgi:hypothetical protein
MIGTAQKKFTSERIEIRDEVKFFLNGTLALEIKSIKAIFGAP